MVLEATELRLGQFSLSGDGKCVSTYRWTFLAA